VNVVRFAVNMKFQFLILMHYFLMHIIFALPLLLRLDSIDSEFCHIRSFKAGKISHLEFISTYIVYNRKNPHKSLMLAEIHGVFWNFLWLGNKCHNTWNPIPVTTKGKRVTEI